MLIKKRNKSLTNEQKRKESTDDSYSVRSPLIVFRFMVKW